MEDPTYPDSPDSSYPLCIICNTECNEKQKNPPEDSCSDGNYARSSVMSDRFINFVRSKIFKNKEMTDSFQEEKKSQ